MTEITFQENSKGYVTLVSGGIVLGELHYIDHLNAWRLHTIYRVYFSIDELETITNWMKAH